MGTTDEWIISCCACIYLNSSVFSVIPHSRVKTGRSCRPCMAGFYTQRSHHIERVLCEWNYLMCTAPRRVNESASTSATASPNTIFEAIFFFVGSTLDVFRMLLWTSTETQSFNEDTNSWKKKQWNTTSGLLSIRLINCNQSEPAKKKTNTSTARTTHERVLFCCCTCSHTNGNL